MTEDLSGKVRSLALELDQTRWSRDHLKGQLRAMRQELRRTRAELARLKGQGDTPPDTLTKG